MPRSSSRASRKKAIVAGLTPAEAVARVAASVKKPSPYESPGETLGSLRKAARAGYLARVERALPDPISAEHATALRRLADGFCYPGVLEDWLEHAPMTLREHYQVIAEWYAGHVAPLRAHPARGYWLDFKTRGSGRHRFGGKHAIPGATCERCERPFLHFMSLSTADKRLHLPRRIAALPLLYCWRCQGTGKRFVYRARTDGGIEVLVYKPFHREDTSIDDSDDFPYRNYPASFPASQVDLVPVPDRAAAVLRLLNAGRFVMLLDEHDLMESDGLGLPCHQIGGEPYLTQYPPANRIACPRCRKTMTLLATLCDNPLGPAIDASYDKAVKKGITFTGNPGVQLLFHTCTACLTVDVRNIVD